MEDKFMYTPNKYCQRATKGHVGLVTVCARGMQCTENKYDSIIKYLYL